MGVIPTAGLSLDQIAKRLESRKLVCKAVKANARDLWQEIANAKEDLVVVAHVSPNHFVIIMRPNGDTKFLVRDPSAPRLISMEQSAFSGYFLIVSKHAIPISNASRTISFLATVVCAFAGILVLALILKNFAFRGLRVSILLLFCLSVGCDGMDSHTSIANPKETSKTEIPASETNMFSIRTLELGIIKAKEPFSVDVPISLPPVHQRNTLKFRPSCDCLGVEIVDQGADSKLRIKIRTTVTGFKGVSLNCSYENSNNSIHEEQLDVHYQIAGEWTIAPSELDFHRVQPRQPYEQHLKISRFDGREIDMTVEITVRVLDDTGSLNAEQKENGIRISVMVPETCQTGHYIGQILVEKDKFLIGTATAFWEVVQPK